MSKIDFIGYDVQELLAKLRHKVIEHELVHLVFDLINLFLVARRKFDDILYMLIYSGIDRLYLLLCLSIQNGGIICKQIELIAYLVDDLFSFGKLSIDFLYLGTMHLASDLHAPNLLFSLLILLNMIVQQLELLINRLDVLSEVFLQTVYFTHLTLNFCKRRLYLNYQFATLLSLFISKFLVKCIKFANPVY